MVSVVGRPSPSRGEKERVTVTSDTVGCRPMGRGAEGHIERANGMEEASKVRRGFSKENNHCDWAGMSVAIEPTSS